MIVLKEYSPIPQVCIECKAREDGENQCFGPDAYCYNCEHELERYEMISVPDDEAWKYL